jgi:hypothetical protein
MRGISGEPVSRIVRVGLQTVVRNQSPLIANDVSLGSVSRFFTSVPPTEEASHDSGTGFAASELNAGKRLRVLFLR